MALMYPSTLPDYIRKDPYREAEVWVYERLRTDLDDSWRCYYSRPWLGLTPSGEEKDGEADFVIAHADHGFLTLEIKGGEVWREEGSEQWFSKNRLKITNRIKDPAKQASDSKYELLRRLKEEPGWGRRYVTMRHGVVFPDSGEPDRVLGPSMPRFMFASSDDCRWLGAWIQARLSRHGDRNDTPGAGLKSDGLEILHQLLAGRIEFRTSLRRALSTDRREIERLTREQYDLLVSLEALPQLAISGGAGTGKTLLALEKALRAAEQGQRVLLACFNAALGEDLRRLAASAPGVSAGGFHSLCLEISGVERPSAPDQTWFDSVLPKALAAAVKADPALAFDTVIVDEAQDFQESWLETLRFCLRDPAEGGLYVFYDDNQKVYRRQTAWVQELPKSTYHLTRNLRNTQAIHACSKPWYVSPRVLRASGPEGQPVDWKVLSPGQTQQSVLAETLHELMTLHGVAPGDIAVLTCLPVARHPDAPGGTIGNQPVLPAGERADGVVVFDTIRRFKGLDRPVVILIDIDRLSDPELTYVALTRASLLLSIIGAPAAMRALRDRSDGGTTTSASLTAS